MTRAFPDYLPPMTDSFATLTGRVYATLRADILAGRLEPGARLVRRVLAKQLEVSPVPVAEALLRLESDGLVESAPMYGARVAATSEAGALDDLVMREALECQAARECALAGGDEALRALAIQAEGIDAVMRVGADPGDRTHDEAHGALHLAIVEAAGCPGLARELRRLWFRRQMHRAWVTASDRGLPARWHQGLVAAIASRDPARAEAHMRFHVRWNTVRHQEEP
jgi:DNA-binding GntR family transcriptional regulator